MRGWWPKTPWPVANPDLLVLDTVTMPVQINGKRRAEIVAEAGAQENEIISAVMALDVVINALDGSEPKRIIVVPKRIVNIVV